MVLNLCCRSIIINLAADHPRNQGLLAQVQRNAPRIRRSCVEKKELKG
jgi:hypothetical protein